jgi:2-oxoglutarate ferredoxin oxidoreductase subunit delta
MIIIDERYCKGCGLCIHLCPRHVLGASTEVNSYGYYPPYLVDGDLCGGCRQCELYCPDFAIFIVEEDAGGDR